MVLFKWDRWSSLGGMCKFCHVIVKDDTLELSPKPNEGEEMWLSHIAVNKNRKYVEWDTILRVINVVLAWHARFQFGRKWMEQRFSYVQFALLTIGSREQLDFVYLTLPFVCFSPLIVRAKRFYFWPPPCRMMSMIWKHSRGESWMIKGIVRVRWRKLCQLPLEGERRWSANSFHTMMRTS